jgi:cytochrome P450
MTAAAPRSLPPHLAGTAFANGYPAPRIAHPLVGPPGRFLLGHVHEVQRDFLGFVTRCAREYGDLVPLTFAGQPALLAAHPALAEEVLVTRNQDYVKGPSLQRTRSFIGNGLVVSEGDFWRRQRRLMQPAFHRDRIAAYSRDMAAAALARVGTWRDGEVRAINEEMMALTLQIVAKTLCNAEVAGEVDAIGAATATILAHIQSRIEHLLLFFLPDSVPTAGNRRYRRAVRRLEETVYRVIDARQVRGGAAGPGEVDADTGDLLSMLLQARDDDGRPMTRVQLRDEVMTLFLAGHETTALTLSWAIFLLAQHPAAYERLLAEVDSVLGGPAGPGSRVASAADLSRLRFTQAVIDETLRLYPPAAAVTRLAIRDTEVGGARLPRRGQAIVSQWVLHRDPRYFEDPEAFQPQRWLAEDGREPLAKRLPRFAFFPFGGGQRVCIGAGFALTEATLLLAIISQRFRLTLLPGQTITPRLAFTLRPSAPIRVLLRARNT